MHFIGKNIIAFVSNADNISYYCFQIELIVKGQTFNGQKYISDYFNGYDY